MLWFKCYFSPNPIRTQLNTFELKIHKKMEITKKLLRSFLWVICYTYSVKHDHRLCSLWDFRVQTAFYCFPSWGMRNRYHPKGFGTLRTMNKFNYSKLIVLDIPGTDPDLLVFFKYCGGHSWNEESIIQNNNMSVPDVTMYAHFVFKAFDVNCNGAITFRVSSTKQPR